MTILIINGPNLNRIGRRMPDVYGKDSMEQMVLDIQRTWPDMMLQYKQSNHEGDLIDWLQAAIDSEVDGIVLNAGGLTHTSVSLRDAVEDAVACGKRIVEVHISDISKREEFRRTSLLTAVCSHSIIGQGMNGYKQAILWLNEQ